VIDELSATSLSKDKSAKAAFEDLRLLLSVGSFLKFKFLQYCEALGVADRVRFEPSLARGLDYLDYEGTTRARSSRPSSKVRHLIGGAGE